MCSSHDSVVIVMSFQWNTNKVKDTYNITASKAVCVLPGRTWS